MSHGSPLLASRRIILILVAAFLPALATAQLCPPTPSNLSPAEAATDVSRAPVFRWNPGTGFGSADRFDIVYALADNCARGLCNWQIAGSASGGATQFSFNPQTPLLASTEYVWKVGAFKTNCNGGNGYYSNATSFVTEAACSARPTDQLAPRDNETELDPAVTFQWDDSGADNYQLGIRDGKTLFTFLGATKDVRQTVNLQVNKTYEWVVRAHYGNCFADSTIRTFATVDCTRKVAPALISPAAGASDLATTVNFQWENTGAVSYQLFTQRGTDAIVAHPVTTSTSMSLVLSAGSDYQWKVRANYGTTCPAQDSEIRRFTTAAPCPTTAPSPVTPANKSTQTADPITFSWTAVSGAAGYEVWAQIDGKSASKLGQTTGTSLTVSVDYGEVEWWVIALFPRCTALTSVHFIFQHDRNCPTAAPQRIAPADGAELESPVTFDWSDVPNATGYQLRIQPANAQLQIFEVTQSQHTVTLPLGATTWSVAAKFASCPVQTSDAGRFTVIADDTCEKTSAPVPVAPADGETVTALVTFSWGAVPNVTSYAVAVGPSGGTMQKIGETDGTSMSKAFSDGAYRWVVIANFADCPDLISREQTFTVKADSCSITPPQTISPAEGATVSSPVTFSWSAVSGASGYRVWAAVGDNPPELIGSTVGATSLTTSLESGPVTWVVEVFVGRCSEVSDKSSFTVAESRTCGSNAAPQLIAPASGAAGVASPVTFSWSPVAGAYGYRVWVSIDGAADTDLGATTGTTLTRAITGKTVEWRVEALFAGCRSTESEERRFSLADTSCPDAVVTLLQPSPGASVNSPVDFDWTDVPNASLYRVWISIDGADFAIAGETTESKLTRNLKSGSALWYVEVFRRGCDPLVSEKARFTILAAENCSTQKPQLLLPAANAVDPANPVVFSWSPVAGAVGYQVWASHNDGAFDVVGATKDTTLEKQLPPGRFQWFVVAYFTGCPPTRSDARVFVINRQVSCERPRPVILSPQTNATVESPVRIAWTAVADAVGYDVFAGFGNNEPVFIRTVEGTAFVIELPAGRYKWFVRAKFASCPSIDSLPSAFTVVVDDTCRQPDAPAARTVRRALSGQGYAIYWTPVAGAASYELQEDDDAAFATPQTFTTQEHFYPRSHEVTAPTPLFYRVRAVSDCSDQKSLYSDVLRVVIHPNESNQPLTAPYGSQSNVTRQIRIGGEAGKTATSSSFTATTDQPWLTVSPSSGQIPPEGLTLTVTGDPSRLPQGTATGTVLLTQPSSKGAAATQSSTSTSFTPFSISTVTVVEPVGKTSPPPDAMIIPAVANATGFNNSMFVSDVRLANISPQPMMYDLHFTLSGTDGTESGQSTSIQVEPGQTMALNDIVQAWFGMSQTTEGTGVIGVVQITPQHGSIETAGAVDGVGATSVASSRTYNLTDLGTFGQFVPAVPYSQFVGRGTPLTLQQIAESPTYRTNFGFVEGSGQPASLLISVFDSAGNKVRDIPLELRAGEHKQLRLLQANGIELTDGRVEVSVTSETGKVTTYASVLDLRTSDPLLVSPVDMSSVSTSKLVIPGVADLQNGTDSWRTDLRVFNGSATPQTVFLDYLREGTSVPAQTLEIQLQPGEVSVLDDVLRQRYGVTSSLGSIHVRTTEPAQVSATARTYNLTSQGTFGQFIPAVSAREAIGVGDRALQVLQMEQSAQFRSNLGLVEVTGNPVELELTAVVPGAFAAPVMNVTLSGNEFRQLVRVLQTMNLSNAYNARVTVKVVGGSGKVAAYGSMVDEATEDPTYVPAQ